MSIIIHSTNHIGTGEPGSRASLEVQPSSGAIVILAVAGDHPGEGHATFTLEAFEARELAAALVNAATESERWR